MSIIKDFFSQTAKPEGRLGSLMISGMNGGHADVSDWGMKHLEGEFTQIADIGCGGGRNVGELLKKFPQAHVMGVDYSKLSIEASAAYNEEAVIAGRCGIIQGNVADLPFEDGAFDAVTAFETVYFWPGPEASFAQVHRVLRPGGKFLIVMESDGNDLSSHIFEKIIDGMHVYTGEDLSLSLQAAGFRKIDGYHHAKKPWIVLVCEK